MTEIIPFEHIEKFVGELRDQSAVKIAFTNGCFDILHRGHVQYLEQAKTHADILIVGLNSDRSVRILKGENRPHIRQEDRAYILSRIKPVDVVCIFDQDTPLELIRKVLPDFLIKGGDYALNEIVGREVVEAGGGQVLTIPLVQGRSTSNILKKIMRETSQEGKQSGRK